jgi:hypothetical protein
MPASPTVHALPSPPSWRALVLPKEHGGWSLTFEPLVLALLAAPSWAGLALALALVAAFFLRRPLKQWRTAPEPPRSAEVRAPIGWLVALAATAGGLAVALGGVKPLVLLIPTVAAGLVFVWCDLRGEGREQAAELAGAAAFAFVPAGIAAFAGWPAAAALALAAVMLARAVPTVLVVRAYLRMRKGERGSTGAYRPIDDGQECLEVARASRPWVGQKQSDMGKMPMPLVAPALLASCAAVAGVAWFAAHRLVPWLAVVLLGGLAVRAAALLVWPRPAWRARQVGIAEAAVGTAYVVAVGLSWPR